MDDNPPPNNLEDDFERVDEKAEVHSSEVTSTSMDDDNTNAAECEAGICQSSHAAMVKDLVYWRAPLRSGVVLAVSLILEMSLMCCSFISVVAYTGLTVCIVSMSFRIYKQLTAHENPFANVLTGEPVIPEECVRKTTEKISCFVNCSARTLAPLIFVENYLSTLKFMFMLWIATYVGACFNFLTLVMLATISAFSAPRIYEDYKVQIDDALQQGLQHFKHVRAIVMEKISTLPVVGQKPKTN